MGQVPTEPDGGADVPGLGCSAYSEKRAPLQAASATPAFGEG